MKKSPTEGGCWYCKDDSGEMAFSCEFDTFVHMSCLIEAAKCKEDQEAQIMARELIVENDA